MNSIKTIDNDLKQFAVELNSALKNVETFGAKAYHSFDFDCSILKDWNTIDIRDSIEHKEMFNTIRSLDGPVLYWFEILPGIKNDVVRNAIFDYKFSIDAKTVPALKRNYCNDSNALYVGKVKSKFWGRVIQHLGYYHVVRTQGLQLYHWSKPINLKLRLHAYHFEREMEDLVSIFEVKLAKKLRPITGKHY